MAVAIFVIAIVTLICTKGCNNSNNEDPTVTDSIMCDSVEEEYPEIVDMGVSVLWRSINLGAEYIDDYGINYNISTGNIRNWPKNISSTKYDIAQNNLGKPWRMPTKKEFDELVANCDIYEHTWGDVNGCLLVSKINKNELFFPYYKRNIERNEPENDVFESDKAPYYWTSNCIPSYNGIVVYCLYYSDNSCAYRPSMYFPIRPVMDKEENQNQLKNSVNDATCDKPSSSANNKTMSKPADDSDNTVYDVVEENPIFSGGDAGLMTWLQKNIKYPVSAQENGIQGRVLVSFIVEKDGSLSDVRVLRTVSPELDNEAVRVIRAMPNWIPGRHKGNLVRVKYTLPITFNLR